MFDGTFYIKIHFYCVHKKHIDKHIMRNYLCPMPSAVNFKLRKLQSSSKWPSEHQVSAWVGAKVVPSNIYQDINHHKKSSVNCLTNKSLCGRMTWKKSTKHHQDQIQSETIAHQQGHESMCVILQEE